MSKRRAKGRRDSDRCHIVGRTVNFNLEDPLQKQLYEKTLQWTNFSGRIKRLLEAEVVGTSPAADRPIIPEPERVAERPSECDENFDPITSLFGRAI